MTRLDWRGLSLREKIGQTMMLKADPAREINEYGSLKEFLARFPAGGIFICKEALENLQEDWKDIRRIIEAYREASRFPLLIAADVENGCGSLMEGMDSLPSLMALGATGSEERAYAYGRSIALEATSLGLDWSFSPVADLNINPLNPITNIRALTDEPALAIQLLAALVRGMQDSGLAATVKHFPGDGVDSRDQHLVTTCNSLSREDWWQNHGAVFQSLIDGGVDAVMTGHISMPAYQRKTAAHGYPPATLSPELTSQLLKGEMGFRGVVISDALDMGGFLKWYGRARGEVECFKAGTDMLLWPSLDYFDHLEKAIATGEVSMARIDDAMARIQGFKERHGLLAGEHRGPRELTINERSFIKDTATEVAEGGLTLLRDRKKRLPLERGGVRNVLIIAITPHDRAYEEMAVLKRQLEERGVAVTSRRNIRPGELEALQGEYDVILYALMCRPHRPKGPLGFFGPEADSVWAALTSGAEKSIVVSFGSPYHGNEYFEAAEVVVNVYSLDPASQKAVARALFGEIAFAGRSPVHV